MKRLTRRFLIGLLLITFTLSARAAVIGYPTDALTVNSDNIVVTSSDGVSCHCLRLSSRTHQRPGSDCCGSRTLSDDTWSDRSRQIFGAEYQGRTREGLGLHAQPTGSHSTKRG